VDAVSLQTCYLPPLTPESVAGLRAQIDSYGLGRVLEWGHPAGLEGGANRERRDDLLRIPPLARVLGCDLLRFVCGNQFYWAQGVRERRERLTPFLRELAAEAKTHGLRLAVENHADFNMVDLVAMVEVVGADTLGICFDTGNAVR
jgi:sugar phosphate isomerase/epimerase